MFVKNYMNFRIVEIGKEEEYVAVEVFTSQRNKNPCKNLDIK